MSLMNRSVPLALWILLAILPAIALAADPTSIAVLYPKVKPPYDKIFNNILLGIADVAGDNLLPYAFESDQEASVQQWLQAQSFRSLVVLGQASLNYVDNLDANADAIKGKVVVGAVRRFTQAQRQVYRGIAYEPAPQRLLHTLKELVPDVQRVIVVYDVEKSAWLIALAEQAAQALSIKLLALPSRDIKDAAGQYRVVLKEQSLEHTAIWLSLDAATMGKAAILPMLLKEAWRRNILLFSSALMHVQHGVLFSLYPDNIRMGRSIGELASHPTAASSAASIAPLEDLLLAMNRRTAQHLRLKLSAKQWQQVDLMLPAQR